MRYVMAVIISSIILFSGCSDDDSDSSTGPDTERHDYTISFEQGMDGWVADGTDLEIGDTTIDWSVAPSTEMATDGEQSLKLYLNNTNDAGKIWAEKQFRVEPLTGYKVTVSYDFASSDWGVFNLFHIITGVSSNDPSDRDDLTYQDETGNGAESESGFIWMEKGYDFQVTSDKDGLLYVTIGVWGSWETPRTYYIDNVSIEFDTVDGE